MNKEYLKRLVEDIANHSYANVLEGLRLVLKLYNNTNNTNTHSNKNNNER